MKLSTCAVLLAVIAVAFAAPQYGKQEKLQPKKSYATTTALPANDQAEFDCTGKENRGYVLGCMQDYYLCWDEVMTKASCPENMVYNQENGQCDFNINVFECTGVRTTTAAADEPSTLKPISFDCSKLTDGDYALSHDCQAMYVSCVGGAGRERTCPDDLSFDPENRVCERLENIEACGGAATTVLPQPEIAFDCPKPTGAFPLTSALCSAVYYNCVDNVASIAICEDPMIWDDANKVCALPKDIPECSFDCTGKADSAFSEGCSNTYWWCWAERATKLACPEDMMFDSERQLCDVKENIVACGGELTTLPPFEDLPQPTMKPVDFSCAGLEDGQHAFKNGETCQPKFVSCVGGFAWEMTCPEGLLFDPEMLVCEHIENIVPCGGTAKPAEDETTTLAYGQKLTTLKPKRHHKTTTVAADLPKDDGYGSYETTTIAADVPTTKAYGYKKTTTVRDIPTTKAYGYKKTTTLADIPTTKAYGYSKKTTTVRDIPTTKAYGYSKKTTTLADIPTTKAYGYSKKTTTLADEPITTTLGYNSDYSSELINLDLPTTKRHMRQHKTTTVAADLPNEDSYGSYETTTRRIRTTTVRDIPTTKSYGYKKTTTFADIPTTKSYGYKKTTTLADIPTTKSYGYKKTTTVRDIPTTKSYGYKKTTTLADIPTTKAYHQRKTTTLADEVETDDSYGSYETTTMADIPTTTRRIRTTTVRDIPTTKSYGGYQKETTLLDLPLTTQRTKFIKAQPKQGY